MSKLDCSFILKFGVKSDSLPVGVFPGVFSIERGLTVLSIGLGVILKSLVSRVLLESLEFYGRFITNFLVF